MLVDLFYRVQEVGAYLEHLCVKTYQTLIRGFSDEDTWDLEVSMMRWLAPRLRRYIKITKEFPGHPGHLTEEKWREILEDISYYIHARANDLDELDYELMDGDKKLIKSRLKKFKDGNKYFNQYRGYLWW